MDKDRMVKIGTIVLIIIIVIVTGIVLGVQIKNLEKNNNSYNDNNVLDNVDNDYSDEDIDGEDEYYEFLTQLPTFNDDFEKALFIYGWFHYAETLWPYIDRNIEVEENYNLLKLENFKTIQDMKNYSYEVFEKDFIDSKFNESTNGSLIEFKENADGVLVLSNAHQYEYKTGYTSYNKVINNDGTISYKVNIKANLMGEEYSCDTTYEYKMEKNSEGKLVFKTFESPVEICLDDANSKLQK